MPKLSTEERAGVILLLARDAKLAVATALNVQPRSITCSVEDGQDEMRISLTVPISSLSADLATTTSKPTESGH